MWGEAILPAGKRVLLAVALAVAALAFAAIHPSGAHAARGMDLGLYDGEFNIFSPSIRDTSFDRAVQANADWVLIYAAWSSVAPGKPSNSFEPANAADPQYNWETTDAAVRDATARGLKILLAFTSAPAWAEGPNRPGIDKAPSGTWDPDPNAVGDFAKAIATRYSGSFMGLPAVRYWQLWAEPNLAVNLGPQFDGNTPVGFNVYRPMLNAFYNGVKAANRQNVVVTGGTAPYGGLVPAGGLVFPRMQPLAFWRGLLCYGAGKQHKKKKKGKKRNRAAASRSATAKLIPLQCPNPARFDVAAHHPINAGAPTRAALNPDDISTPDLYKLKRVLNAAAASGRVVPGGAKPIWATELWWNSNPPGRGLPLGKQARYLEQAFYVLWKQGVQATFWFEVRDAEVSVGQQAGGFPVPTTGLFLRDGTPKPALTAFQFPFVTERLSKNRVRAWGEAPGAGPVSIQIRRHRFRHLKTFQAGANRVFVGILHLSGKARLRAQQGSQTSLVWRQG
ncbi:MAG: hypothetical protein ACJ75Z_08815 [Solirubrobacterales bacterium]